MITFETTLFDINGTLILHLPTEASLGLPSRGPVMVEGTINGQSFASPLEPDGRKGHWMPVELKGFKDGDNVEVELAATKNWPVPKLPADVQKALDADPEARELWYACTPMAQWEWIRWIRATNSVDTRAHHIVVGISKLRGGHRRPCCFNSGASTDFTVSKNGVLLDPAFA